jgi:hypothetical protein
VVAAAVGVGPICIVGERSSRVLLNGFIDRPGAGEYDLEAGFLQSFLDGEAHSAANHDVTVADRVDQIMVATVLSSNLVVAAVGGSDLAEFPTHLDPVVEVDNDESFGATEVCGDRVPVQRCKCDLHSVEDTVEAR